MNEPTTAARLYCRCGAALDVAGVPLSKAGRLLAIWTDTHHGTGHGMATAKAAAAARRRSEDREARADALREAAS